MFPIYFMLIFRDNLVRLVQLLASVPELIRKLKNTLCYTFHDGYNKTAFTPLKALLEFRYKERENLGV